MCLSVRGFRECGVQLRRDERRHERRCASPVEGPLHAALVSRGGHQTGRRRWWHWYLDFFLTSTENLQDCPIKGRGKNNRFFYYSRPYLKKKKIRVDTKKVYFYFFRNLAFIQFCCQAF